MPRGLRHQRLANRHVVLDAYKRCFVPRLLTCACALALYGIPGAESQIRPPLRVDSTRSTIEGIVQTASGSPLSQFAVVAQDERTGTTYGTVTGTDGRFVIQSLPPGTYMLSAGRAGFKEVRIAGLCPNGWNSESNPRSVCFLAGNARNA